MEETEEKRNKKEIRRMEKIYERTEMVVRMNQSYTDSFKTRKGVR